MFSISFYEGKIMRKPANGRVKSCLIKGKNVLAEENKPALDNFTPARTNGKKANEPLPTHKVKQERAPRECRNKAHDTKKGAPKAMVLAFFS